MATTASEAHHLASQLLTPTNPQWSFTFTPFLQTTHQHSLPSTRPVCKAFASGTTCPLKTRCPERHVLPRDSVPATSSAQTPFGSLVCKHWLRGLCKKGDACEFLHEYNLRRMPECSFFVRNGYCSNGDECLYLHVDPESKLPPCPHYERGFCPLGPRCAKKHVRRRSNICAYYMAGFCPEGRKNCNEGAHPKWEVGEMEKPKRRVERSREEEEELKRVKEEEMRERMREREREDGGGRDGYRDGGHKDRFGGGGGRGGRWRGKGGGGRAGGGGFRGRGH